MPFYQYKAADETGRESEGMIRAETESLARVALTQAGFRVLRLADPSLSVTAAKPQKSVPVRPNPTKSNTYSPPIKQAQVPSLQGQRRIAAESPASVVIQSSIPKVVSSDRIKTKTGNDRDLFFIFTQLSQYFKAGMAPQGVLQELAGKSPLRYRPSLIDASNEVAEGKRISDVLEKYPYLYSPDVIGTLRVGEVSGNMTEACTVIGVQKEHSFRLKRRLSWFLILFFLLVGTFPISLAFINGSLKSMAQQDKAGGALPVFSTLTKAVSVAVLQVLPWALPMLLGLWGLWYLWHTMPLRNLRQNLILRVPILGGRVRAESMARFTWAMGLASQGGLSGQQTFQLAAETVPNDTVREQLTGAAGTMLESERLSTALKRSGTLPVEYTHIVETGELTGNVPRALSDIHRATDADYQGRDSSAAKSAGIMLFLLLAILTVVMLAFLYKMFYSGMITQGLNTE